MPSIADILIAKGNAEANAASAKGNIYADLIRNLSSVPGQFIQQQRAEQRQATQDQESRQRLSILTTQANNEAALQPGRLTAQTNENAISSARVAELQQDAAGSEALKAAMTKYATTDPDTGHVNIDTDAIYNEVAPISPKVASAFVDGWGKHNEVIADTQNKMLGVTKNKLGILSNLAGSVVDASPEDKAARYASLIAQRDTVFKAVPEIASALGKLPPTYDPSVDAPLTQLFEQSRTQTERVEEALKRSTIAKNEADAKKANAEAANPTQTGPQLDAEAQKLYAKRELAQQGGPALTPEDTAAINAYEQRKTGDETVTIKTIEGGKPVEKVMKKSDALKQGVFPSQPSASVTVNNQNALSTDALDAAAKSFIATGQMPIGARDRTTQRQIMNRAAELSPKLDLATNKAAYEANRKSLDNITKTLDTLSSFESTAGKNLDQFLSLADKVPDTGVPWVNQPIRTLNEKFVGSANQAAFNAARDVALREISRVTNDPKLSGALTDSARAEVSALSPKDATFAQIKAVAKVLKQDMANVHSSLSEMKQSIIDRIPGSPAAPASTSKRVYYDANGNPVSR